GRRRYRGPGTRRRADHDRAVRPLQLHRHRVGRRDADRPVDEHPARDGLRGPRTPRDDGSRRSQGLAAGPHVGLCGPRSGGAGAAVLPRGAGGGLSTLPLLPVTTVGSWPRSDEVLRALSARRRREITAGRFLEVARSGVREAVRAQLDAGVDLVTDGEQTRDNFDSFVAEKLDGVQLMTLAEMLDVVEDKEGFRLLLHTLDVRGA